MAVPLFDGVPLVSGAKPAHAAVLGGDYRVPPAPCTFGAAQGALLHQELINCTGYPRTL
jgi:hypothetical protein